MRKTIFLFSILLFYIIPAFPQSIHGSSKKGAMIEFNTSIIDYDTITEGAKKNVCFQFTNTGDEPLIISSVISSCGCTTPSFDAKPVMPGKTGKITVKYNTSLIGAFRKTIVVKSNAVNQRTSILTIRGYVKKKE